MIGLLELYKSHRPGPEYAREERYVACNKILQLFHKILFPLPSWIPTNWPPLFSGLNRILLSQNYTSWNLSILGVFAIFYLIVHI